MMRAPHRISRAGAALAMCAVSWLLPWPGLAKETGNPSLAAIQAAYEDAKTDAKGDHDDGLIIREADCQQDRADGYSCQISFTASRGLSGRLYFDVIGLNRERAGWKLVSGLCKRHE